MITSQSQTVRQRLHTHLTPEAWPAQGMSPTNIVVSILIIIGALSAVLDTEPTLTERFVSVFFCGRTDPVCVFFR